MAQKFPPELEKLKLDFQTFMEEDWETKDFGRDEFWNVIYTSPHASLIDAIYGSFTDVYAFLCEEYF